MELNIYTPGVELTGIVDTFSSLIWHRKFHQPGYFEILAPATPNNIRLLKKYALVEKEETSEVGYINTVQISRDSEKGTMITASGTFLSGILSNRVILQSGGTLSSLLNQNCISSSDTARNIPGLILAAGMQSVPFSNAVIGKNLGTQLEALSRYHNFGYRITLDHAARKLVFGTFYGVDRSIEQTANPQVVFSREFDNLLTSDYLNSDVGAVNTVYGVCKLPPGIEPCTPPEYSISVGAGTTRFETSVETDAVTYDVTRTEIVGEGSIQITRTYLNYAATLANMQADCAKILVPISENFEGTVSFSSGYKKLYDLGDVVTIFDEELGVSITQRITEVLEVYDHETNAVTPTFGNPARTITDILKG